MAGLLKLVRYNTFGKSQNESFWDFRGRQKKNNVLADIAFEKKIYIYIYHCVQKRFGVPVCDLFLCPV